MAEDNQNPANPTPSPTGDEVVMPPPTVEENPTANKIFSEPLAEAKPETVEPEPTPEPIAEPEPVAEPIEAEPEIVKAKPTVESVPEPTVKEKAEITETPQPVSETPTEEVAEPQTLTEEINEISKKEVIEPETEVAEPEADVDEAPTEKVVDLNQTIEAASVEEPTQTEEEVELIRGDIPKPGDKIESKEIPQTETEEDSVGDPAEAPIPPPPSVETEFKTGFKEDGVTPLDAEEKLFSAIGYISFLALLPFLTRRDSEFAQHHGRQALVIFIVIFIFTLLFSFSGTMRTLGAILTLAVAVSGGMLAYKGDWFKVPGIYDLSLKLKNQVPPPSSPPQNSEEDEA